MEKKRSASDDDHNESKRQRSESEPVGERVETISTDEHDILTLVFDENQDLPKSGSQEVQYETDLLVEEVGGNEEVISSPVIETLRSPPVSPSVSSNVWLCANPGQIPKSPTTTPPPISLPTAGFDAVDRQYLAEQQPSYTYSGLLGKGAFTEVISAVRHPDGDNVAIKLCKVGVHSSSNETIQAEVQKIHTVSAMGIHENVVQSFEIHYHPDRLRVYVVTEFSQIGDLYEALHMINRQQKRVAMPLNEHQSRHLIRGIAKGVAFLHRNGMAHGDIKPQNVLLFWSTEATDQERQQFVAKSDPNFLDSIPHWIPKLSDFGNSVIRKTTDPEGVVTHDCPTCTINYAAPESWPQNREVFDAVIADAYSVGCCLLRLLLAGRPFTPSVPYPQPNDVDFNGKQLAYVKECNKLKENPDYLKNLIQHLAPQLRQVLEALINNDIKERLSVINILEHPWLTKQSYEQSGQT